MNLKSIISTVAPALATALGGPLAGVAVKKLAGAVLGKEDAKEDEIAAAIASGSPDLVVKLKELDQTFSLQMGELGIKLEQLEVEDRANARARETQVKDWVPSVLASATSLAFFALLFLMLRFKVPTENKDLFTVLLGGLGGAVTTVLTYYFGSSRGSRTKDEILGRVAEGKE